MADKHQRMRQVLERLSREKGIVGSTVVTRDGICILNVQPKIPTPETFSAMTAALVGAAETAFTQVDGALVDHVVVQAGKHVMVAVGASNEILLVVLANSGSTAAEVLPFVRTAAAQLREALVVA